MKRLLLLGIVLALAAGFPIAASQIYLDSPRTALQPGQTVAVEFSFAPERRTDLQNVVFTLRCVEIDADSPASCTPDSGSCADPLRTNNRACSDVTVLNSPKRVNSIPAGTQVESQFKIQTAENFSSAGSVVELVLSADMPGADLVASGIGLSRLALGRVPAATPMSVPTAAARTPGVTPTAARSPEKDEAMQARIDEYLRKKEARRARRALQREGQPIPAGDAVVAASRKPEPPAPVSVPAPAPAQRQKKRSKAAVEQPEMEEVLIEDDGDWYVVLPRPLADVQDTVRRSELGNNTSVREYLDLIAGGEASPHELAAFGNFLAQNGFIPEALVYYDVALSLEENDSVLWMNAGTLHRQLGSQNRALAAYVRALRADPTNAGAHYNLGATYDTLGRYEEALEEYKIALTIDPALGDPAVNPQAASNDRLLAVKTQIYQEQIGAKGLPLADVGDKNVKVRVEPGDDD